MLQKCCEFQKHARKNVLAEKNFVNLKKNVVNFKKNIVNRKNFVLIYKIVKKFSKNCFGLQK